MNEALFNISPSYCPTKPNMHFTNLLQLIVLTAGFVGFAVAHPGDDDILDPAEFARRRFEADKRHVVARNCAPAIARYESLRRVKRGSLRKRVHHGPSPPLVDESLSLGATSAKFPSAPHYKKIVNSTCILAPDVTEGPYYINNEMVRQNLTDGQRGVELILDIGVIDIETCKPLKNAFVELWMANATGVYGGYPATLGGPGGPPPGSNSASGPPPGFTSTPHSSIPLVRNETFLRGGWHTNKEGIVEMSMIYTGYYQGRTPHIHTMVHMNWEKSANGTLISHAGTVAHIGQFFFDEAWNDKVFVLEPYTTNTNNRTLNTQDSILSEETANGNNAFIDIELLGDEIADGLLGYVTMGVNASASVAITNTNYYNSSKTDV